ncbi:MAG: hypothetical protein KDJ86_19995 [Bauldia sp.]|uniref:hypothetical protein n=1 Tax=Bauldia sp. TaxID=2575872 RepID=UPI001E10B78E|nr:hypothetical protein [Bauldia sp.]MCB1498077.1 hypothetical protein [Bauldia sp.]
MRAITIADTAYLNNTRRLVVSFLKHHPDSSITVFCDNADAARRYLTDRRCRITELAGIATDGAKRAKFTAYRLAAAEGSFLFLDSDIIVLSSLAELEDEERLVACADDMSGCPFIEDKQHPWPGDPGLAADIYFNSGIVFFPAALAGFLEGLHHAAQDDDLFARYIFDTRLVDNHFLCAFANKEKIPVRLVDGTVFNWQGLRTVGKPKSLLGTRDGRIVNEPTSRPMRLLHFAGIKDIDAFLFDHDPEILRIVAANAIDTPFDNLSLFDVPGSAANALPANARAEVGRALIDRSGELRSPNVPAPYIPHHRTFVSLALSTAASAVEWNGLPCGAAYFEPDEYHWFRQAIRSVDARSVIEIGAGYTSILLNRIADHVLSIEALDGPWLEDARSKGCDVALVPFDSAERRFDGALLEEAVRSRRLTMPDLLFVDSPNGTANRQGALGQLLELTVPRYLLFHDAIRDAEMVYGVLQSHDYRIVDQLASFRGLVLLEHATGREAREREPAGAGVDETVAPGFAVELAGASRVWTARQRFLQPVLLTNLDSETWNKDGETPVRLSYHLVAADGAVVRKGNRRTLLPCDMAPGDAVRFDLEIDPHTDQADLFYAIDVVREGVRWFSADKAAPLTRYPLPRQ